MSQDDDGDNGWRDRLPLHIDESLLLDDDLTPKSPRGPDDKDGRRFSDGDGDDDDDEHYETYDDLGHTPPRTRTFNIRKWKNNKTHLKELGLLQNTQKASYCQKKLSGGSSKAFDDSPRRKRSIRGQRLLSFDPGDDSDVGIGDNRSAFRYRKRTTHLNREHERSEKMESSVASSEALCNGTVSLETDATTPHARLQQADSLPNSIAPHVFKVLKQQLQVVQTKNRFTSLLSSKPISPPETLHEHTSTTSSGGQTPSRKRSSIPGSWDRITFHKIFTAMLKSNQLSNNERRHDSISYKLERSKEEHLYQNATGDLIWLELQAWFAGRDVMEQDEYIIKARFEVKDTIQEILQFTFRPLNSNLSASSDVFYDAEENLVELCKYLQEEMKIQGDVRMCLDVFNVSHVQMTNLALQEVNSVLQKLDTVEQYYASSRMFRLDHPPVGSPDFQARVKCLCMWYNLTVQLRCRIDVLGNILIGLGDKRLYWPSWIPGQQQGEIQEPLTVDPTPLHSRSSSSQFLAVDPQDKNIKTVNFQISEDEANTTNPSDSNNSNSTSGSCVVDLAKRQLSAVSMSSSYTQEKDYSNRNPLRKYVEKMLKTKGLRKTMSTLQRLIRGPLRRAKTALEKPHDKNNGSGGGGDIEQKDDDDLGGYATCYHPHLEERFSSHPTPSEDELELTNFGTWNPQFVQMNMPSFRAPYLFMCRIPLDVIHECLKIRLEQKPLEPSELSIRQLMRECKEALRLAVIERQKYISRVKAAIYDVERDHEFLEAFEHDMEEFDRNLTLTLEVYLSYLQSFVTMIQSDSCLIVSTYQKNLLEEEWTFIKQTCPHIPDGESFSANTFCQMACGMLRAIGDFLNTEIDEVVKRMFIYPDSASSDDDTFTRHQVYEACRGFQSVFHEARERSIKALSFAKTLRKDLEVSAEFRVKPNAERILIDRLRATKHVMVKAPHASCQHLIFISGSIRCRQDFIMELLDMHCGTEQGFREDLNPGYMVLMKWESCSGKNLNWTGGTIYIKPTAETTISLSQVQVSGLLLVAPSASLLEIKRLEFMKAMKGDVIKLVHDQRATSHRIASSLQQVKTEALSLRERISRELSMVEEKCDVDGMVDLDSADREVLSRRTREILHQCYKFGFEYHKELDRLVTGEATRRAMAEGLIEFSRQWMQFVLQRCERGRGLKPRWASHGIDFLYFASSPHFTKFLSDEEFNAFKSLVEECYAYVIGEVPANTTSSSTPTSPSVSERLSRSLSKPDRRNNFSRSGSRSQATSPSRRVSTAGSPKDKDLSKLRMPSPGSPHFPRRKSDARDPDTPDVSFKVPPYTHLSWVERVAKSTQLLENARNEKSVTEKLIGRVMEKPRREDRIHIKAKTVSFSWQRGVKIGQGHFGKVFTAINNETGDIMAMKEIPLQPNDHKTLKNVADELRIFESIHHKHLINHYGVEVHREEMLIFMEYCPEGTLESLVSSTENGLEESSVRRYTRQLLEAVAVLHENRIVHRDIKGANVFFTDDMQNLKLGDYGCAVKIKTHTTMPGELQGFVGTQAYMAPEVFTKNLSEGYGRAADIWSVGCVVIEMATGKRPWHELESNYQIMFKVGMGESPPIPEKMSKEGSEFLQKCFEHEPCHRATAEDLLIHPFLMVYEEEENISLPMFTSLTENQSDTKYLKLLRRKSNNN